ncbi:MAG: GHKL domain-containing protein [Clostridium sp.]
MKLEYLNYMNLLIQISVCFIFFINVLKFKVSIMKAVLILYGVIISTYALTFSIRFVPLIKPIIMGTALYITLRKISTSSTRRIIMALIIAVGCSFLTDIFAYYVYGVFTNFDYSRAQEISVTRTTISLFSIIFYFTIIMTIAIFMNKVTGNIRKFCVTLLIILPISQIILLFGVYVNNYANLNENVLQYGTLCVSISMVVDLIIYFIINEYARMAKKEKDIEIERIYRKMEFSYYQLAAKSEEDLHKLKHDIKNQLQAAYVLFDSGEAGRIKAKGIVESINSRMDSIEKVDFCDNTVVNTIMSIKALEARRNNIKTEVEIGLIENGIEDIDLCSIFTNLFDNAIEACKSNKNKEDNFIKVKVGKKGGYLVVKFINWCEEELKLSKKKTLIMTKKDRKNHGYGLKIIKEIAKKYEGEFNLNVEDNTFEAIVCLKTNSNIC